MKIGITNDHRGVILKKYLTNYLIQKGYNIIDYGTNTDDSVDYPDYAFALGKAIQNQEIDLGIAICGSGIGMSIALNKVKGIRCAKLSSEEDAVVCKKDNNANAMAISASLSQQEALNIIETFIKTPFSDEKRHQNRIDKINLYENR